MTATLQKTVTCGALNYAIAIVSGAVCFCIFTVALSIYARTAGVSGLSDVSFAKTVWGMVVVFSLVCVFGTLVFLVPGVIHATIVALLSTRLIRHSDLAVAGLAALLGAVIFPAWVFVVANPLQKLWPVISCIAAISCAVASVLSLRIVRRTFPPTSTSLVGPPPLPANDRNG